MRCRRAIIIMSRGKAPAHQVQTLPTACSATRFARVNAGWSWTTVTTITTTITITTIVIIPILTRVIHLARKALERRMADMTVCLNRSVSGEPGYFPTVSVVCAHT